MLRSFIDKHIMDLPDKPSAQAAPNAAPPTQGAPVTSAPVSQTTSFLDADMVADVQKVINRRPTAFSELEEKANVLRGAGLDEINCTKAAFQLLKASGKTAAHVISAIDLHVRDIETEKANFEATSKQVAQRNVAALRSEAEQLLAQNESDRATIEHLQNQVLQIGQRIAERAAQANDKQMQANTAESEIQLKVTKFAAAADSVASTLNQKKAALSSMLS